jgi:DNA polymerase-3 subunit epsilon
LRRLRGGAEPLAGARWVVVDCETSGLDAARDRLISIGAVAVRGSRLELTESYAAVLRQARASEAGNILIHGIGGSAQISGQAPREALEGFGTFAAEDVLVAFHAPFDRAMLERAMRDFGGRRWRRRWLDLAQVMPALEPRHARSCKALDDWLAVHRIAHPGRHDALGDACATAQLLLVALSAAAAQGVRSVGEMLALEKGARWLA